MNEAQMAHDFQRFVFSCHWYSAIMKMILPCNYTCTDAICFLFKISGTVYLFWMILSRNICRYTQQLLSSKFPNSLGMHHSFLTAYPCAHQLNPLWEWPTLLRHVSIITFALILYSNVFINIIMSICGLIVWYTDMTLNIFWP